MSRYAKNSTKLRLSAKRRKRKGGIILKIWREKKKLMNALLSEEEREKILTEIEVLEKKIKRPSYSTNEKDNCGEFESAQTLLNGGSKKQLHFPIIASVFEIEDTNNELITDPFTNDKKDLSPLETVKIKIEPCEDGTEQKCQSQTSPLVTSSSCKYLDNWGKNHVCCCSQSSNNATSCFCLDDYDLLFKVIKYLDDHAMEDKFNAADKYYTFKLKSAARSQQMLAKKLINKVLFEAEKGNLNCYASMSNNSQLKLSQNFLDSYDELDISTNEIENISPDTYTKVKCVDNNMQVPRRGYLHPNRNKVLNKMKESLMKCMKQDRSVSSYAPQLRALSSIQYSFADKLINEILSEAIYGRIGHSSEIVIPIIKKRYSKNASKKPNMLSSDVPEKSTFSIPNEFKPISTLDSPKHAFDQRALSNQAKPSYEKLNNPSLSIRKGFSLTTSTKESEENCDNFLNEIPESLVPTQQISSSLARTLLQRDYMFLNKAKNSLIATEKASFIPSTAQVFEQNSQPSLSLPFPNSVDTETATSHLKQSNSVAITTLTHSVNIVPFLSPTVYPTLCSTPPPTFCSNLDTFTKGITNTVPFLSPTVHPTLFSTPPPTFCSNLDTFTERNTNIVPFLSPTVHPTLFSTPPPSFCSNLDTFTEGNTNIVPFLSPTVHPTLFSTPPPTFCSNLDTFSEGNELRNNYLANQEIPNVPKLSEITEQCYYFQPQLTASTKTYSKTSKQMN